MNAELLWNRTILDSAVTEEELEDIWLTLYIKSRELNCSFDGVLSFYKDLSLYGVDTLRAKQILYRIRTSNDLKYAHFHLLKYGRIYAFPPC